MTVCRVNHEEEIHDSLKRNDDDDVHKQKVTSEPSSYYLSEVFLGAGTKTTLFVTAITAN